MRLTPSGASGAPPRQGARPRLSRDGERLIALPDGTLAICQTGENDAEPRILPLRHESYGLAISPDGDFAITMEGRYRHTYVRHLDDGERIRFGASWHDRGPFDPSLPAWSPHGSFVVVCYRAREVGGRGRVELCRRTSQLPRKVVRVDRSEAFRAKARP